MTLSVIGIDRVTKNMKEDALLQVDEIIFGEDVFTDSSDDE